MTAQAFTVRAPGKLILCGEYAVVHGTPALCTAVARYARCRAQPVDGQARLTALGQGPLFIRRDAGGVVLEPVPADAARFGLVRDVLARSRVVTGWAFSLDSAALHEAPLHGGAPVKLGLGSSAAAAVALAAAVDIAVNGTVPAAAARRAWFELAQRAHAGAQGGLGSGIDVAASAVGGMFVYERATADPADARILPVDAGRLGVRVVTAWTGSSASTPELLGAVEAWRRAQPDAARALFAEMDRVARQAAAAANSGHPAALLAAVEAYGALMESLGERAGRDIVSAPHRRVREIARACGCAGKPSGAGGGDVAVCLCPSEEHAARVRTALAAAGIAVVDVELDGAGVSAEPA
ncbi:MAG: hypothetical protein HY904_15485 [Deltaproteobacteria bacterium]|nr:hypothetical protein [Deltaproteobacteria bacterium]